jgi:hypothetical protein
VIRLRRVVADDRGSGEVVATIAIAPIVIGFVVLVFFLGRQVDSRASVRTAAEAAAQAAARARDPGAADAAARSTAASMLTDPSTCAGGPRVAVGLADFRPGGRVTVEVTCSIGRRDLSGLGPPARSFTGRATAVVDTYRAMAGAP